MMKKRITAILLLLVMCVAFGASSFALPPHRGYTYDNMGIPTAAPLAYTFEREVNGSAYNIGIFSEPTDVYVDEDDYIYVLDAKNSRIVIFNTDLELVRILGRKDENVIGSDITYKGEVCVLNGASGLFVYEFFDKKLLYVADKENSRILRFDMLEELDVKASIEEICAPIEVETYYGQPTISLLDAQTPYKPMRLTVDRAERMHVICQSINRGIVKLNPDGTFNSFYGRPDVNVPAYEQFWRLISTNDQLDKMEKQVNTEYNSIDVDTDGFVWVVTRTLDQFAIKDSMLTDYDDVEGRKAYAPVKKLNSYGTDITSRTGAFPPVGDISANAVTGTKAGSGNNPNIQLRKYVSVSAFIDIAIDDYGCYSVLDADRRKVFTYDGDGNLLFQFGNDGNQFGAFMRPVALDNFQGDKLVVLDETDKSLMIFAPTDYGTNILNAVRAYQEGEYETSEALWGEVLKMNSNNMLAYSGVGKSLYRSGDYKAAMDHFTVSKNVEYYSKALEEYINVVIGNSFTWVFLGVIVIVVVMWLFKLAKQFRAFLRNGVKKVM